MGVQLDPTSLLGFDGQDHCLYDTSLLEEQLREDSRRLFVDDNDLYLQVLESGKVGTKAIVMD